MPAGLSSQIYFELLLEELWQLCALLKHSFVASKMVFSFLFLRVAEKWKNKCKFP